MKPPKTLGEYLTNDLDPWGRKVEHSYGCTVCGITIVTKTLNESALASKELLEGPCKKHQLGVFSRTSME